MKPAFIKLLLNNTYYNKIKSKLKDGMFEGEEALIWNCIKLSHEEFKRDLKTDELYELIKVQNPVLTSAVKNNVASIIDDIKNAEDIGEDVGSKVISHLWRKDTGLYIANYGLEISEGKRADLLDLQSHIKLVGDDFLPNDAAPMVPTDVDAVLEALQNRDQWKFNIPSLYKKLPGMSGGDFLYILARPESGKTAFITMIVAGPGGFAEQGAKTHVIFNEEPAIRTMIRAISANTGMTKEEIEADKLKAKMLFDTVRGNIVFRDDVTMTLGKLDVYCRRHKPDVLIIDQLDRVSASGNFESSHERLGEIYSKAREIAKVHDCLLIGVSQASAEAQGKSKVHYSHSEGSKTAKAAAADVVLGIGMTDEEGMNGQENTIRSLYLSKNKINGYHGLINVRIVPKLSRYTD